MTEGIERRRGFRAILIAFVLAVLAFSSTGPRRRAFDTLVRRVFPSRLTIQVVPGNARVLVGSPLVIVARLAEGAAPVDAQVEIGEGDRWRTVDMTQANDGRVRYRVEAVSTSFKYRVIAGAVTSPTYVVSVASPPRVTRIDLDYTYPDELGLAPRVEQDAGNVSAPRGATVRVHVHTDQPVARGHLTLGGGERIPLTSEKPTELSVVLRVEGENSYRVILAGADGLVSTGEVEYLIHAIDGRSDVLRKS